MTSPFRFVALLALASGCGVFTQVDEDNFAEVYAEETCKQVKRCYRAQYDGEFDGDLDECVDNGVEYWEDLEDYLDDCDFDDDKAKDCIRAISGASCEELWDDEDLLDDCWEVYSC